MSPRSFLCSIGAVLFVGGLCEPQPTLDSYLSDLKVTAASVQYTAELNARLVGDLQERLARREIDLCDGGGRSAAVPPAAKYRLHEVPLSWNDARKTCSASSGGRLAVVRAKEARVSWRLVTPVG